MIEPQIIFGAQKAFLDCPAQAGGSGHFGQRSACP